MVKAKNALARHYHCRAFFWDEYLRRCERMPPGEIEGLLLLVERIGDIGDWSAITRFVWLCNLVWEMECAELARKFRCYE
jgi:hypothetical protein